LSYRNRGETVLSAQVLGQPEKMANSGTNRNQKPRKITAKAATALQHAPVRKSPSLAASAQDLKNAFRRYITARKGTAIFYHPCACCESMALTTRAPARLVAPFCRILLACSRLGWPLFPIFQLPALPAETGFAPRPDISQEHHRLCENFKKQPCRSHIDDSNHRALTGSHVASPTCQSQPFEM